MSSACSPESTRERPTSGSTSPCRRVSVRAATCWWCAARRSSSRSAGRGARSRRSPSRDGWTSPSSACTAGRSTGPLQPTTSSRWTPPTKRSGQLLLCCLRRLASGALRAVRHRLATARVGDRDEKPTEQTEVTDEQPALLLLVLLVLLRPERVPGRGVGHDRQRQREGGQPRHPVAGEQQPGADLRAGDGLRDDGRIAETERAAQRLRLLSATITLTQGLHAGGDERGTEQQSGESTKHMRSQEEVGSPLSCPHTRRIGGRRWPRGPLFATVARWRTDPGRTLRPCLHSGPLCAGSTTGARDRPARWASPTPSISCCSPSRAMTTIAARRSAMPRRTSSCGTTAPSSWSTARRPVGWSNAAATR